MRGNQNAGFYLYNSRINDNRVIVNVELQTVDLFKEKDNDWAITENRELKQLRRRSQQRLQKNNRFNDQNNSSARASPFLVHFFDVHCTTTT